MNEQTKLTVVMPAYNEEELISAALDDVRKNIFSVVEQSVLLVIDDGSTDNTSALLDKEAEKDQRIEIIHQKNGGHGRAVMNGLDSARGEFVLLIDSDRQIPLTEFSRLWKEAEPRDAVFGIRTNRQDPLFRIMLTRFMHFVLGSLLGFNLKDANVPFKIFRREHWEQVRPFIPEDTVAPSLFFAVFMKHSGKDFLELPVTHLKRETEIGLVRKLKLLSLFFSGFAQLMKFNQRLKKGK